MPAGYNPLATTRIQRMFQALMDIRQVPPTLKYLARTPIVPATDGEIIARVTERAIIADVVNNDQAAVVRNDHQISLETVKIPNIKRGTAVTQEMLNLLQRINAGLTVPGDENIFENYLNTRLDRLLTAVRSQMNLMCVGMWLDSYSWSGNGVQTGTITFGAPSDLKVTPSISWATSASAVPITDIQTLQITAREKYGVEYNRITLSSADFRDLISTTQFRNLASTYSQIVLTANTFPTSDMALMTALAGRILNLSIDIDDSQYGREANDGTFAYTRNLPAHKVILSSTTFDSDPNITDFANGIVTESIVGSLGIAGAPQIFSGAQYGPVSFATLPNADLNPPNANLWGVARGFPRKHMQAAHAVLTVG